MRHKKSVIGVILSFFCIFYLTGCKARELEERSFPMLMTVEKGEYQELTHSYIFPNEWSDMNAYMDYNHLKIILLDEEVLEEHNLYDSFLENTRKQELLPRNTYICVARRATEICDYDENLVNDVGTYIENMLKTKESLEKSHLPTLGDLLDDKENQMRKWNLPILSIIDGQIKITGEYQILYGFPLGER